MIDKILILTSEHQPYRRAGLLATLTVAGVSIRDTLEFLWSYHANDYSDDALLEMLEQRGVFLDWHPPVGNKEFSCILSQILMERIALEKIIDGKVNALYMHDDFHFNIKYSRFLSYLENLSAIVGDIDIITFRNVQRDPARNKKKFGKSPPPIHSVNGIEQFVQGCPYDTGGIFFINPSGAQRILDKMNLQQNISKNIDDIVSDRMHSEQGIYALRPDEFNVCFVSVRELEGESIGYYVRNPDDQEKMIRPLREYNILGNRHGV